MIIDYGVKIVDPYIYSFDITSVRQNILVYFNSVFFFFIIIGGIVRSFAHNDAVENTVTQCGRLSNIFEWSLSIIKKLTTRSTQYFFSLTLKNVVKCSLKSNLQNWFLSFFFFFNRVRTRLHTHTSRNYFIL